MDRGFLKKIIEAALLTANRPLSIFQIHSLFYEDICPSFEEIQSIIQELITDWESRSVELKEINSGYRFQVRQEFAPWIARLWEEKPPRYSRAFLETLALIAYRQPITRGEIEQIRGVATSSGIIRALHEQEWIKILGHKEVPGRPALYGTTSKFLDQLNLKNLDELPPLKEITNVNEIKTEQKL
ncbi:SMC-Scp complex subunit ScpB [Candidatus Nitrosacidococcus tergens]|uniref:Segregation and condensation protein B homolog n=1 Tax=Candidatus Nitrosacidococcus tergens TaxID=553981 RepID=A0A7G1QB85_9GAMM|nr:SMC-Scp complex subunit ScpB [Candidatus Nitrosacidococcus tergens]CAB1277213.1 Segregation and condensation protein B homolog [Candidatus Nitrosacidococcus tergens]